MEKAVVLLLDDTMDSAALLNALADAGHEVRLAIDPKSALQSLMTQVPDIILVDMATPGIAGCESCRQIKENQEYSSIPIIFISSEGEVEEKIKAFEAGAVDYIVKPYLLKEVLARIAIHLRIHQLQHAFKEKVELIDKHIITSETDLFGVITQVSQALCDISGYTKEEFLGNTHQILRHSDMPKSLYAELWSTIRQDREWIGEIKNRKKDGGFYWVLATISPKHDARGQLIGYRSFRQLITDHKRVQELSITDQLTQLYNRHHFNEVFPGEIKRAMRSSSLLSFLMLDIDLFKPYNDRYGHQAGDETLSSVAKELKEHFKRLDDFTFRLGGEEFCAIFTTKNQNDPYTIAMALRERIEALHIIHESNAASAYVTVSLGVVTVDLSQQQHKALTMDILYKAADEQLYLAKSAGRNQLAIVTLG